MRLAFRFARLAVSVTLLALGSAYPARADDTADEADLRFRLGAEAYQRQEYRVALEHFHASQRLAPNRNVLFNIGRTYENLGNFPAAFRYYDRALEGETVPEVRANVEASLARISAEVAVLAVQTTPPGATIYVDRRDLGPRGTTPRRLGLPPGRYRVLAELPGYESATATVEVARGATEPVAIVLRQILGSVRFAGTDGAEVRVDDPRAAPLCVTPCTVELAPGAHRAFLSRAGYRTAELAIDVQAEQLTTVRPELGLRTGEMVVGTDEPGALVEIDGVSRGFTPAVVTLPIGDHSLRVSSPGFQTEERQVRITEAAQDRVQLSLLPADEVTAASRVTEEASQAPSSVSIVPRAELRALAYPTLAEALRGTRGVYVWDDRAYVTLGIRGLGRLGSYGTRVLVLQDGVPMNDDWIGASYVGYDAMTDLGDVERVELIRGPGSALYGTGAFSGVINVVTRSGAPPGVEAKVATELDGVARARVRGDAPLGEHGSFWLSASAARGEGRDFLFPEHVISPALGAPDGHARGVDGFESGTTRGRASWRWLSLQWFLHDHRKVLPAHYDTLFGDPGTWQRDTRGLVELKAEPAISDAVTLASRVYFNHYTFRGEYARALLDGGLQVDTFVGDWVGTEHRVVIEPADALRLTLGGDLQHHFRIEERGWDETGVYLDHTGGAGKPYQIAAAYGVVDADLSAAIRVSAGVRLDSYSSWGSTLNPRAALILRPYREGNTKVLFGRAFRAPSVYELYYNDDGYTQIEPRDPLGPETIYTTELEHQHSFSPTVSVVGAAHASTITNLMTTAGAGVQGDPLYYTNASVPLVTAGAELGLRRDWRQGYMGAVSYSLTAARFLATASAEDLVALREDPGSRRVGNIPQHAATVKGAAPIFSRRLTVATRLTVEDGRWDRYESAEDEVTQRKTDPYALWDVVVSGHEGPLGLEYAVGVYNLFGWSYALPVSDDLVMRTFPQSGRTFLASLGVAL